MQLPGAIIIGGMKCGTTALHRYLAEHPQVHGSSPKELNFFFGDVPGGPGNWWRGPAWYASRFPHRSRLGVEASPGYTSPDHPEVAARMSAVVPGVRLIYLMRDPWDRAVSQYRHHRRDGDERRPIEVALLDPDSQYIARSRHGERLRPFTARFPAAQIAVVEHRRLLRHRRSTLRSVFRWLDLDEHWDDEYERDRNVATTAPPKVPSGLRERFLAAVAEDMTHIRGLTGAQRITV